ncbi:unnamed protein product [[Candida] boidinii]|nr:unnamed protein product [[Candida] boidinii]
MIDPSIRLRKAIIDGNFFITTRLLDRYPDFIDNINPENGWSNLHYSSYYDRLEITKILLNLIYKRYLNNKNLKIKEKFLKNLILNNHHPTNTKINTNNSDFNDTNSDITHNTDIENENAVFDDEDEIIDDEDIDDAVDSIDDNDDDDYRDDEYYNNANNNESYTQINSEDEILLTFKQNTVIHLAASNNSYSTLELLLNYFNVCIDQRGENGYTPSHISCLKGFPNCLKVLLNNGAYPNIQDNNGNLPLHLAMSYGYLECIILLIKFNSKDDTKNNDGCKFNHDPSFES